MVLNHMEYLLTLDSSATKCVSVSDFASLVDNPIGITSSAVGLQICAITALQVLKGISQKLRIRKRNLVK